MTEEKTIKLDNIIVDNSLNPREGALDQLAVMEYAANVDDLPPMTVFEQLDGTYLLAKGFHRMAAHRLANRDEARFIVRAGSREEAEEEADLDNLQHGIPLTRREKRAVIGRQLKRHPEWSDVRLATACHTTDKTVRSVREELERKSEIPRMDVLEGADGIKRPRTVERPKPAPDSGNQVSLDGLSPPPDGNESTGNGKAQATVPAPAMNLKPLPEADPEPEKPPMKLEMSPPGSPAVATVPDLVLTLRVKMDKRLDERPVLVSLARAGDAPLVMKSVSYEVIVAEVGALLAEHGPDAPADEAKDEAVPADVPEAMPEWLE